MKSSRVLSQSELIDGALQDADDALEDVKHDLNEFISDIEALRLRIASLALNKQLDETDRMAPR